MRSAEATRVKGALSIAGADHAFGHAGVSAPVHANQQPNDEALEVPLLVGCESYEFAAPGNLDLFFSRVYSYWHGRGLRSILLAGCLNLLALSFTAAFSTFLLLFVDWRALHAECIVPRAGGGGAGGAGPADGSSSGGGSAAVGGCDLASVGLDRRPLLGRGLLSDLLALAYLAVCGAYLGWSVAHFAVEAVGMREVAHFMASRLGIGEGKVAALTWAEVASRLVIVQRTTRLCIAADLDEQGIVGRIMRKENYLIGMLNRGVLRLHLSPPETGPPPLRALAAVGIRILAAVGGGGRTAQPLLTRTLEWNLRWAVLDHMFDDSFRVRPDFYDVKALKRRLRLVALANAVLSPCLLLWLAATFACRNAERLYRHPASLGSRRWSGAAAWAIRELNELPHYLQHRLSASHPAALRYCAQFPSHTAAAVARLVVFVTGSFVSLLLAATFLDESLLERPLLGRQVVWWLGTMGLVLAACRTLVSEEPVAYDPERAMADVVSYTHYLPRSWRGRAHTEEVQSAFLSLFRLKLSLFAEELVGLVTTPLLLACALPESAGSIVEFVSSFTAHVEGLGDVCSLAHWEGALARHGNAKYGAPVHQADKALRSRQGKVEKSFLTFAATYPTWQPGELGRRMLATLEAGGGAGGGSGGAGGRGGGGCGCSPSPWHLPLHQVSPTTFPYQAAAAASEAAGQGGKADRSPGQAALAVLRRAMATTAAAPREAQPPPCAVGASTATVAASQPDERNWSHGPPLSAPPRLPPPPPPPLYGMPYGVTSYASYSSNADVPTADERYGDGGGVYSGWVPYSPSCGGGSGGGGAAAAAASPSPSVASSQFSNLAAPCTHFYPVPLLYLTRQQRRQQEWQQQQQQQHKGRQQRSQQLAAGGGGAVRFPGSAAAAAAARAAAAAASGSSNGVTADGGGCGSDVLDVCGLDLDPDVKPKLDLDLDLKVTPDERPATAAAPVVAGDAAAAAVPDAARSHGRPGLSAQQCGVELVQAAESRPCPEAATVSALAPAPAPAPDAVRQCAVASMEGKQAGASTAARCTEDYPCTSYYYATAGVGDFAAAAALYDGGLEESTSLRASVFDATASAALASPWITTMSVSPSITTGAHVHSHAAATAAVHPQEAPVRERQPYSAAAVAVLHEPAPGLGSSPAGGEVAGLGNPHAAAAAPASGGGGGGDGGFGVPALRPAPAPGSAGSEAAGLQARLAAGQQRLSELYEARERALRAAREPRELSVRGAAAAVAEAEGVCAGGDGGDMGSGSPWHFKRVV